MTVRLTPTRVRIFKRRAALRELHSLGVGSKKCRSLLNVTAATFYQEARKAGLVFPYDTSDRSSEPARNRASKMASMYRAGMTLQQIGDRYGISRERVRQIMTKHEGIRQVDGGQAVKARLNRQRKKADIDHRYLEKHGCTFQQYKALREIGRKMLAEGCGNYQTPIYAFFSQRNNAIRRGIEFRLKLWQWWAIWQESGKWSERGKRRDGYVMSRFMDQGAYELGNVYIGTLSENSAVQPNNPYRSDHPDHERVMKEHRERRLASLSAAA